MFQFVTGAFTAFDQGSMRNKLRLASVTAVAATLATAILSAGGSGASAQEHVPVVINQDPAVQFVAEPMVQPLPAKAEEPALEHTPQSETDSAASLHELVSVQPHQSSLSPEMRCLAGAIYFEARGESLEGQLAVGRVIIERADSGRFPDSYCGVVFQRSQFSFVRGRSLPAIKEGTRAWRNAVAIARIADAGSWDSPTEGALFFHATHVSPQWRLTRLATVDNHVFYR